MCIRDRSYPTLSAPNAERMEHPDIFDPTLSAKNADRMGHPEMMESRYAYTLPPAITCCVLSSKVTFWPVWIAATFMHSATLWL